MTLPHALEAVYGAELAILRTHWSFIYMYASGKPTVRQMTHKNACWFKHWLCIWALTYGQCFDNGDNCDNEQPQQVFSHNFIFNLAITGQPPPSVMAIIMIIVILHNNRWCQFPILPMHPNNHDMIWAFASTIYISYDNVVFVLPDLPYSLLCVLWSQDEVHSGHCKRNTLHQSKHILSTFTI